MHLANINTNTHAHTCLGNDSRVLALTWLIAHAAEIFTVDTEHVFVAHDEI